MSSEQVHGKETLGILVPLAPTIILATFVHLNKGPHGELPYMDVTAKRTASWLTTPDPDDADVHLVVGPEGIASPIGVTWTETGPLFLKDTPSGYEPIGYKEDADIQIANLPPGEPGFAVYKERPHYTEEYTVFQVPPATGANTIESFNPYVSRYQLMSGFKNRGRFEHFATSALAIRVTDRKYELPFGGELRPPRSSRPHVLR